MGVASADGGGATLAVVFSLILGAGAATVFAVRANKHATRANEKAEDADREAERAKKAAVKAIAEADRADREARDAKTARGKAEEKEKEATREANRANVARHAFQMTAAWQAWQQHDIATAETLLEDVPPKYQQSWEYRHVRALCRRKAMSLKGHTSSVRSVAYSPDGKRIVSGSYDKTVKVWDAATGQDLLSLKGHTGGVSSVAYSPDGKRIVSGSYDKTVKVWDAATGQELLSLKGHMHSVASVAYSPDGKRIVSGSQDKTVKVWDAATGQDLLFLKGHTEVVYSVAYSPDGKRIVSGSHDNTVKVWDAPTGLDQQVERIVSILRARATLEFHSAEAETAENNHQPFAAIFHLDRLLPLLPEQRHKLLFRRNAVLAFARKADAKDAWAVRALTRQAISDPDTVPDRKALLPRLAELAKQQDDALTHRLHGGLLLRTGSAKEAVGALQAAIKKRDRDAPPVDELLLALAHAHLNQPAEARKHLQTAVAWMDRGVLPGKAAALAGLAAGGPWRRWAASLPRPTPGSYRSTPGRRTNSTPCAPRSRRRWRRSLPDTRTW